MCDDWPEDDGLSDEEADYWDDDPYDGVEFDSPEPNCMGAGCYDSGFDWRGRRCASCNPSRWQRIYYGARWHLVIRPWLWLDRKIHRNRPDPWGDEPPF